MLVWFLRGNEKAALLLTRARDRALSQVSWMELVQGARNKRDLAMMRAFLPRLDFRMLPLTENIGHRATLYLERHALRDGIQLADALIAATAVEHGLPVATANIKHYRPLAEVEVRAFKP